MIRGLEHLRAVRKDHEQLVGGIVTLDGDSVMTYLDVKSNQIASVDLDQLFNKAMLKSAPQVGLILCILTI